MRPQWSRDLAAAVDFPLRHPSNGLLPPTDQHRITRQQRVVLGSSHQREQLLTTTVGTTQTKSRRKGSFQARKTNK